MNNKITSIQVLGSGCPTCKKLFELTKEAVSQLDLGIEVEYITDIQKIIELGLMSSPVLMINGKAALIGAVPSLDKVKEIISSCQENSTDQTTGGCSCGGNC